MTPHIPPTQAELDEWRTAAREGYLSPLSCNIILCLITEIERLQELCGDVRCCLGDRHCPMEVRLRAERRGNE